MNALFKLRLTWAALLFLLIATVGGSSSIAQEVRASQEEAADEGARESAGKTEKPAVTVPFFGNETCPIMGKKVTGEKFAEKDGKRVYVCCSKCVRRAEADFDKAYAAAYPADKVKDLKNEFCPIMGGETEHATTTTEFQGHLVHFCCAGCDRKFHKQPNRHLSLLTGDAATGKPLRVLGNEKCLVATGKEIAKDTFFVYEGVLIDASSGEAIEEFRKAPELYLKAAGVDLGKVGREEDG